MADTAREREKVGEASMKWLNHKNQRR